MRDTVVSDALARAGLLLLSVPVPAEVCPPQGAWVSSCSPADGRIDEVVDLAQPDGLERFDEAWLRLATRMSLFAGDGAFLLAVTLDPDNEYPLWTPVRLTERWNVSGRNPGTISGPIGSGGLLAASMDGEVIISGTTWQDGTASALGVPHPYRAEPIRRYVQGMLDEGELPAGTEDGVRNWLMRA
ncbi:hypothetical protein K353_06153 [Kitasatospora sp. SolWspMP-SS2h]|uniref:hypothetical protein n=1 Tax=Kitasatospora sp. SolWspMP-SS2h TaxID=1305729 RepID=UPI000DC046C4|nr:hypothetical protein [Kitasatospora sp. SolWspMP-SS2h]RAJ31249.1 hypothetical protein K353_06153 [Kitasatospora sp. SolWspMP-SS2h]